MGRPLISLPLVHVVGVLQRGSTGASADVSRQLEAPSAVPSAAPLRRATAVDGRPSGKAPAKPPSGFGRGQHTAERAVARNIQPTGAKAPDEGTRPRGSRPRDSEEELPQAGTLFSGE